MPIITPVIESKETPLTTCPKCGSDMGWRGPKYQRGLADYVKESIAFECRTCGFVHYQTPLDRK